MTTNHSFAPLKKSHKSILSPNFEKDELDINKSQIIIEPAEHEQLIKRFPAIIGAIDKWIEGKIKGFEKYPFEEKYKSVWCSQIGNFIQFYNPDGREEEEQIDIVKNTNFGGVMEKIRYEEEIPKVDTSQFKLINSEKLMEILGLTIKKDNVNKLITFLCQTSAYTEESQLNISNNAPSSTGKSYIPIEISELFPKKDVIIVGYCSPTAFFHDVGEFDKEIDGYIVDLSKKILIFLDQPHTLLIQHLRPLLSHDRKEIRLKITDKSQKKGLRTKNVIIKGYPSVIFCTAGLRIDEQEATRFIMLSPETTQEKIREAINEKIERDTDKESYSAFLEENPERKQLKQRILAIKQEEITDIKIDGKVKEKLSQSFFNKIKILKPRHQRDIGRLISFTKIFCLLNVWFREREGNVVIADNSDLEEAIKLWDEISESQELNLPPFVYNIYKEVIIPVYEGTNKGLSRNDILKGYFNIYGRALPDWMLRQQIIPMLENSGLITQDQDTNDRRKMLISPTTKLIISQNNSELSGKGMLFNKNVNKNTLPPLQLTIV